MSVIYKRESKIFKIFIFLLLIFPISFFSQSKRFFNKGEVIITQSIEKIPLNFINDIPIVKVEIEGEYYNFLFDTGAPLVISNEVYNRLNLKSDKESDIEDTNKEKRKQKFTYLPMLKAGNVMFKNFGAVVIDFEDPIFKCYNVTGILGANQMAKLYWKIDYQNNKIEATKNLENFEPKEFTYKTRFTPLPQKSPKIYIQLNKENREVLFDTGFAGSIALNKSQIDLKDPKIAKNLITTKGIGAVGMYGMGQKSEQFLFTTDDFSVGNMPKSKQIIETMESAILGNTFLKNYIFILDWKNNEILFKESEAISIDYTSFGFSYKFVDGKMKVLNVFKDQNIPLILDDEIVSIDGEIVDNLSLEESCQQYLNSKLNKKNELILKVRRGTEILDFKVKKKNFFIN